MRVPLWLGLLIATAVILFGFYRLYLAIGGPPDEERAKARRGMLAMARRSHALVGILYLLVGGALLATSLGFNPFRSQPKPAPAPAPAHGSGSGSALQVGP